MLLLIASATLGRSWPEHLRWPAHVAAATLISVGVALLVWGGFQLGSSLSPFPKPRSRGRLTSSGPYRLARHPMYGGGVLFAFGWAVSFPSVISVFLAVALAVFLDRKATREEVWLSEHYRGFDEYRRQVRRKLIPLVY
jgi:protein-S-isoprenylcysteine O-methyltransferase Ste14